MLFWGNVSDEQLMLFQTTCTIWRLKLIQHKVCRSKKLKKKEKRKENIAGRAKFDCDNRMQRGQRGGPECLGQQYDGKYELYAQNLDVSM